MNEMTSEFLVTVSVITYNHEKFVRECLDSVLSQKTSFKFCVLVSDDCSSDSTFEILNEYSERYNNVFIHSRCGLPKSRVNGKANGNLNFIENFRKVRSKYIAYCDGDDKWASDDKLQIQIDYLEMNPDVAITCSTKNQMIDGKVHTNKSLIPDVKFSYRWLYFYNPIPASSVVFRKNDFRYPPTWYTEELDIGDWPLWFLVAEGKKIYRTKNPLLNYRVHPSGAWTQKKSSERVITYLQVIRCLQRIHSNFLLKVSYGLHYIRFWLAKSLEGVAACLKKG